MTQGQLDPIQLMRKIAELEDKINALRTITTGGVWTSYTTTWTASVTNPTLGNGTLAGRYCSIGKLTAIKIKLAIGSTTNTGSGTWYFSTPLTVANLFEAGSVKALDNGVLWYNNVCLFVGTDAIYIPGDFSATFPFTWATGDQMWLSITGELP